MSEADIYRRAARIVAAMDPRHRWRRPAEGLAWTSPAYTLENAALWDGFAGAARVLEAIADEIENNSLPTDRSNHPNSMIQSQD